jgi:glycosyltransferase involved in cell wall biosynthesis
MAIEKSGVYHKKILLVSSGQPSLNPRLVKEADALTSVGYEVIVLYTYWNNWGTLHDKQLFAGKKWKAIRLCGDPEQKQITWFLSRLIHKASKYILQRTGIYTYFADIAISRGSYFLIRGAKKHKADLYIAHNLGALPAVVKAAEFYKKPCGFDAEDFHRQEVSDDVGSYNFKISSFIEDRYFPFVNYITASSPLIAGKYALLYKRSVTCILNVFPKTADFSIIQNENKPLKLFWFSQTIGPNRGLETIVEAMSLTTAAVELHLLGQTADGYQQHLLQLAQTAGVANNSIFFYDPVMADQLFKIAAQFDIGVASETGFCLNNNIALSNKLFTYIQSGLAVAASNTPAQSAFMKQYPQIGKTYSNAKELSIVLTRYDQNRELLFQTKNEAFKIGQNQLNWENESRKFLNVVERALIPLPNNEN